VKRSLYAEAYTFNPGGASPAEGRSDARTRGRRTAANEAAASNQSVGAFGTY
jgi:hypothetical protein